MKTKLLLGTLLILSTTVCGQTAEQELYARKFTDWVNKVVHLTPEQYKEMKALRLQYNIKKDALEAKTYYSHEEKVKMNKQFYKDRDKILDLNQQSELLSFLVTSREIKIITSEIPLEKEKVKELRSKMQLVNKRMVIHIIKLGKFNIKFLEMEKSFDIEKDLILGSVLTPEQYNYYTSIRDKKLKEHATSSVDYMNMKADSVLEGYNVLLPDDI
ncbi:hypothetical protein [Flammeovirga sp. SJP92]|uniref:hypothetical protein n=1 Tax=Flammeovirga sp. SJP92 TaxID=1775430 RepID=UPI000787C907|nr:hypothetical protein [Flammeovirga sp. SJP92]KXX71521.1 hypothetical protein AVL50_04420 [Flammeovirga sp. SJP92]